MGNRLHPSPPLIPPQLPQSYFTIASLTTQGWEEDCSHLTSVRFSIFCLLVDMLKDVIQEYEDYFPEIIERASYALEKVKGHPWGIGVPGKL